MDVAGGSEAPPSMPRSWGAITRQPRSANASCGSHMRAFSGKAWMRMRLPRGRPELVERPGAASRYRNRPMVGTTPIVNAHQPRVEPDRSAAFGSRECGHHPTLLVRRMDALRRIDERLTNERVTAERVDEGQQQFRAVVVRLHARHGFKHPMQHFTAGTHRPKLH